MTSFVRVDGRIIHGQAIICWPKEYPRGGVITVNDKATTTPVLEQSLVASTDKKVFVWTREHFPEKVQTALDNSKRYLLIMKNPVDMRELLVDNKFVPSDVKRAVIGPCNNRPGATKLGQSQSTTQEEAKAYEAIINTGCDVFFALLEETTIGSWPRFRSKFGY